MSKGTRATISTPPGVEFRNVWLREAEWRASFLVYYREARDYDAQALEDALFTMDGLGLGDDVKKQTVEAARQEFESTGTTGKGALGEAHFAYHLECRCSTILTTAEWKRHPFDITQGIDLVGLKFPEMLICHVEVKTYADIAAGFREAVKQLDLDTMLNHFLQIPNAGRHTTVAVTLLTMIRNKTLPATFDASKIADACAKGALGKRLHRIAGVVADELAKMPGSVTLPTDASTEDSFDLVLLSVEKLPERIVELTGIETAMEDSVLMRHQIQNKGGCNV